MPVQCPNCDRSFSRSEHLKRHVFATHLRGKRFTCDACGKSFARADSCRRHYKSRHGLSDLVFVDREQRTNHACEHCVAAKAKCDGESSCSRCNSRQLTCVYVDRQASSSSAAMRSDRRTLLPTSSGPQQLHEASQAAAPLNPPSHQGGMTHQSDALAATMVDNNLPTVEDLNFHMSTATGTRAWSSNLTVDHLLPDNMNWLPICQDPGNWLDLNFDFSVNTFPAASYSDGGSLTEDFLLTGPYMEGNVAATMHDWSRSPSQSRLADSPFSSSQDKRSRLGYLHGEGARDSLQQKSALPPVRVNDIRARMLTRNASSSHRISFEFPGPAGYSLTPLTVNETANIGITKYLDIRRHFEALVTSDMGPDGEKFSSLEFPPIEYADYCLSLYLDHIDTNIPLVHRTVQEDGSAPWFLILAMVTVGSSRDLTENGPKINLAFHEFLRTALQHILACGEFFGKLAVAQACLLSVVGMSQLQDEYVKARLPIAIANMDTAVAAYRWSDVIRDQPPDPEKKEDLKWRHWVEVESHNRLILQAWHLRMFLAMSTNLTDSPALPTEPVIMPCNSNIWYANTEADWMANSRQLSQGRTFWSTLRRLYMNHKIDDEMGEISRIFLIYGVLGRTEEVAKYIQEPLRQWNPTPHAEHIDAARSEVLSDKSFWLPSDPQYSAWRNCACDCLDTLHWKANSETAAAKGLENSVVLHLHFARLVLLSPFGDIMDFATNVAQAMTSYVTPFRARHGDPKSIVAAPSHLPTSISKWLVLDGPKGRLSIVHAGAVFWHLRRYAKGLYYEPFSLYLATLVIWTFSRFRTSFRASHELHSARGHHSEAREQSHPDTDSSRETDDDSTPLTILIDRPCDDEIVQTFVRKGAGMSIHMSRAGDVTTPRGLRRVLSEAIRMLGSPQYANFARPQGYQYILAGLDEDLRSLCH